MIIVLVKHVDSDHVRVLLLQALFDHRLYTLQGLHYLLSSLVSNVLYFDIPIMELRLLVLVH